MAPLEIISYEYVPERHRRRSDHPRVGAGKPSRTHRNEQQIQQGGLAGQVLQSSISEVCANAHRAGEKINQQGSADISTRQGIQDVARAPNYEASFGGGPVDKAAFGREFGYHQAEITMDNSVNLGDLYYLFDDLDANRHFEEERGGCVIEYHSVYDTTQKTEASVGLTSEFVSEAVCEDGPTELGHPALGQQRSNTRQRGTKSASPVPIDSSSEGGIMEESDCESVFENSQSEPSKSRSRDKSQGSSSCPRDSDENVAKPTARLRVCPPSPGVDFSDSQNNCTTTEPHGTSNPVHHTGPQIDDEDSDSDNNYDELLHSPAWYRFGPSAATTDGTNTIPDARPCYIAQVEDAFRDREFYSVIGKEYVDGEVHYMVEWVPTLVRGSILRKAQAQPLISRFEALCQNQKRKRGVRGEQRPNQAGGPDETQRKRRNP